MDTLPRCFPSTTCSCRPQARSRPMQWCKGHELRRIRKTSTVHVAGFEPQKSLVRTSDLKTALNEEAAEARRPKQEVPGAEVAREDAARYGLVHLSNHGTASAAWSLPVNMLACLCTCSVSRSLFSVPPVVMSACVSECKCRVWCMHAQAHMSMCVLASMVQINTHPCQRMSLARSICWATTMSWRMHAWHA